MRKDPLIEALIKPRVSLLTMGILLLAVLFFGLFQGATANAWPALFVDNTTEVVTLPVLISELLAHTDPPQKDTVELYNPNREPVNVSGWYLSDAFDKPKKFKIPANSIVPADGYLLLEPDDFPLNSRFVFSAEGEEIYLFAADAAGRLTGYYHGFSFGASPNGVSFGRYVTSTDQEQFLLQSAVTLGAANAAPQVGPVVISVLGYRPESGDEYIALTNITNAIVPLYDPAVPDNTWRILGRNEYALPANLNLLPNATLWVVAGNPSAFRATNAIAGDEQIIGPYPYDLPDTGSKFILQRPDTPNNDGFVPYVEVDVIDYTDTAPWPTLPTQGGVLHRLDSNAYGNDPANWGIAPTPHATN